MDGLRTAITSAHKAIEPAMSPFRLLVQARGAAGVEMEMVA
jgi:hypothetical protein